MVRLVVAPESLLAVQAVVPQATAAPWPRDDASLDDVLGGWADVVLVGPGLGASAATRDLVERTLRRFAGPVVLDADALNVFAGDLAALRALLAGRSAVLTPHPAELARLAGATVQDVLDARFEVGAEVARATGAVVLLKGVPTVVSAPDGRRVVSARGTAALAVGGSGDVLGGVIATLLGQSSDAVMAAAGGAWAHGRAAELATAVRGGVRGTALDDVLAALPAAWRMRQAQTMYPVLAALPAPPP
jgi:NAD(P)H-hydrate epimerase